MERSNSPPFKQSPFLQKQDWETATSTFLAATLQCWLRNILSTDSIIFWAKEGQSATLHQHRNANISAGWFCTLISHLVSSTDVGADAAQLPVVSCWRNSAIKALLALELFFYFPPPASAVRLQTASPCTSVFFCHSLCWVSALAPVSLSCWSWLYWAGRIWIFC